MNTMAAPFEFFMATSFDSARGTGVEDSTGLSLSLLEAISAACVEGLDVCDLWRRAWERPGLERV